SVKGQLLKCSFDHHYGTLAWFKDADIVLAVDLTISVAKIAQELTTKKRTPEND
ncbi:unnamed protein product, partial [Musa banksii]